MPTNNTDLFSYIPGLEVTENELLEAELATQQILKAKFPTLDLREGTALRDLNIRPNATLLGLINKALVFYFQNNTISDVTNSTPQVFVDKLMSNWFLSRKIGVKTVINARLYFAKAKSVNLYTDVFFSTDGTLKFFPITSITYSPSDLTFEPAVNQYYLDVDLIAENTGTQYNVTSGSLLYFTNFDPFFLRAEINYLRVSAEDVETNEQFVARAKNAISTRNNINVPSISANLTEYFTNLKKVYTVGTGDPEMVRDQIKVLVPGVTDPIWIHNGGKTDVYCRTPVASTIVQLSTDNNGRVNISGSVYKIDRSLISGGSADDTVPQFVTKPVTSITSTGGVATVTCTAHGYTTGQVIHMAGATQSAYNGDFAITNTGANTFTYAVTGTPTSPATGTILAGTPITFVLSNGYTVGVAYTAITRSGSTVTLTSPNHGLLAGERIGVSGATQTEYNGTFIVSSVPSRDTLTYTIVGTPTTPGTFGGSPNLRYIDRYNEVGFSERQVITADFGVQQANKTVSFTLSYHDNIDGYQGYLSDATKRVLCGDLLARGFNLCLLDLVVTGYNGPAPSAETCNTVVVDYLDGLNPGEPFVMADLLAKLYAAGITTIKTPVGVTFTKYWKDWLGTTTGTITDTLNPHDTLNLFLVNSVSTTSDVIA